MRPICCIAERHAMCNTLKSGACRHRACVFEICQMTLEGSTYSDILTLLVSWQASRMRVFSSLKHKACHRFFVKRPSKKINFELVMLAGLL